MPSDFNRFLRLIPVLLIESRGRLVKSIQFKNHVYVGDPQNAVKIFNEKEVDELIILDIRAAQRGEPDYKYVEQVVTECFMPVTYGGGVFSIESFSKVIAAGVEKVSLSTVGLTHAEAVSQAAARFGSSSVVVTIDVKKDMLGRRRVYSHFARKLTDKDPVAYAQLLEKKGAGEILLQSVDRDGTMEGYDLELIKAVASAVTIPVIACGGAGSLRHFSEAMQAGASAAAAGSKFVFYGKHRAVLINYPDEKERMSLFNQGA